MNIALVSALAVLTLTPLPLRAGSYDVELGTVEWLRDLDAALAQAKAKERPIFALFQEVPG